MREKRHIQYSSLQRGTVDIQIIVQDLLDKSEDFYENDKFDEVDLALLYQWSSTAQTDVTKSTTETQR
jgi:hypothetical protein